ncbi:MAG: MBL fold metallo-hydrolase [Gemmataceae bacterium]
MRRWLPAFFCIVFLAIAGWIGSSTGDAVNTWVEVSPGVYRTATFPTGYALVAEGKALLFDAPHDAAGLAKLGVKKIDAVLLTHHHRDTVAALDSYLKNDVKVRAAKQAADWLDRDRLVKFWKDAVPIRNSRQGGYLVHPVGFKGIDFTLEDGQRIDWQGWKIDVLATPGHTKEHLAFAARKQDGPLLLFAGDTLAGPGKLWTPFTTDWDHWTNIGLKPAAESLRKLAALKPDLVLPGHAAPVTRGCARVLEETARAVDEVGNFKSFEYFTKTQLGNAPEYRFLAPEQAKSNGSLPWSKVADNLWITGNTYVLASKEDRAFLVIDPWGERSAKQIAKLKEDEKLGKLELVMFSHAHYDHFDGLYYLPDRDRFKVWSLDEVALPLAEPYLLRAPFLDARPIKFDRRFKAGDTAKWREFTFKFHHLPGQSWFTSGIETTIAGKHCLFTADNYFHQDMFSGTGGWMGLNRSFPSTYAVGAQRVVDVAPEWVLAEHGGPFVYSAEDFRRRVKWGQAGARAADAVCVSGSHRHDWDPNRVHVRPFRQQAKGGDTIKGTLWISNHTANAEKLNVHLEGRGLLPDQSWDVEVGARQTVERPFTLELKKELPAGRHVFPLRVQAGAAADGSDAFFVVDVE